MLHVLLDELLLPGVVLLSPVELDDDGVRPAESVQAGHPLPGHVVLGALREGADERSIDLVKGEIQDELLVAVLLVDVDEGHQTNHIHGHLGEVDDDRLIHTTVRLCSVDAVTLVLHGTRSVTDLGLAGLRIVVHDPIPARDVQARLGRLGVVPLAPAEHRDDQVEVGVLALHPQRVPSGAHHPTGGLGDVTE